MKEKRGKQKLLFFSINMRYCIGAITEKFMAILSIFGISFKKGISK
jgi:hypothetical protein